MREYFKHDLFASHSRQAKLLLYRTELKPSITGYTWIFEKKNSVHIQLPVWRKGALSLLAFRLLLLARVRKTAKQKLSCDVHYDVTDGTFFVVSLKYNKNVN